MPTKKENFKQKNKKLSEAFLRLKLSLAISKPVLLCRNTGAANYE